MKAYIKALDETARRAYLTGKDHPTKKNEKGEDCQEPKLEWTIDEDRLTLNNSKALNAIFNVVDPS